MKLFVILLLSILTVAACTNETSPVETANVSPPIEPIEVDTPVTEGAVVVVLELSKGNIEIEVYPDKAPITVENFLGYVRDGHYDGTVFHRIIPDFMIQGGGFTDEGEQHPNRAPITLETSNDSLKNIRGSVAMARTPDPNSAQSEFFINTVDNDFLNYNEGRTYGYAVFGKVISGMDTVDEISVIPTDRAGPFANWPFGDATINRAYVVGEE